METNYIWHLVGFTQDAVEGYEFSREMNDLYKSLNDTQRATMFREYKENYMYAKVIGHYRLGTFSSLGNAKEFINAGHSDLHRYTTLLIEKHVMNTIDAQCFMDDQWETWYGITETLGDDGWIESWEFAEIDRPDYVLDPVGGLD
jgi:hypothetical protein